MCLCAKGKKGEVEYREREREVMGKPLEMGSRTQVVVSAFSRKRATLFSEAREKKRKVEQGKYMRLSEYNGLNSLNKIGDRQFRFFFFNTSSSV